MGWNDHIDWEMSAAVDDLIEQGLLVEGTAAYGIAQKVITDGFDSLTPAQKRTWEKYVGQPLGKRTKALDVQRIIDSNPD